MAEAAALAFRLLGFAVEADGDCLRLESDEGRALVAAGFDHLGVRCRGSDRLLPGPPELTERHEGGDRDDEQVNRLVEPAQGGIAPRQAELDEPDLRVLLHVALEDRHRLLVAALEEELAGLHAGMSDPDLYRGEAEEIREANAPCKHCVRVCMAAGCQSSGAEQVLEGLKEKASASDEVQVKGVG